MFKDAAARARRRPFVLVLPLAVALLAASAAAGLELASGQRLDETPAGAAPATFTPATGVCKNVKQAFSTHWAAATTSTSYVDIAPTPGLGTAAVTFTVSGSVNTCLIVTYYIMAESRDVMYVRPVIDGGATASPNEVDYTPFDGTWQSISATFVITGVAPGKHTVQMQYRSFGGGLAQIQEGTLVVGFK